MESQQKRCATDLLCSEPPCQSDHYNMTGRQNMSRVVLVCRMPLVARVLRCKCPAVRAVADERERGTDKLAPVARHYFFPSTDAAGRRHPQFSLNYRFSPFGENSNLSEISKLAPRRKARRR